MFSHSSLHRTLAIVVSITFALAPMLPGRCLCSGDVVCCCAIKAEQEPESCCCCKKQTESESQPESESKNSDSQSCCDSSCLCSRSQLTGTLKKIEQTIGEDDLAQQRLFPRLLTDDNLLLPTNFAYSSHTHSQSTLCVWLI